MIRAHLPAQGLGVGVGKVVVITAVIIIIIIKRQELPEGSWKRKPADKAMEPPSSCNSKLDLPGT